MATDRIIEVVPLVTLRKIPFSEEYVAGLMNYRGRPVPVIDLCYLTGGRPCAAKYSTRIILVSYPVENKQDAILGLIAEEVTETIKSRLVEAPNSAVIIDEPLFQARSQFDLYEMVRWFDLKQMLPPHKLAMLL